VVRQLATAIGSAAPRPGGRGVYIIFDHKLKGCTIATAEPTDKTRFRVLGKYKSSVEAEKAIGSMKEC